MSGIGSAERQALLGAATALESGSARRARPLELSALFQAEYANVWRLLRRFGVPAAQLDDAAQEVFWVAARRLADIEPGRERSFLYGVALRISSNFLRRAQALPTSDDELLAELPDPMPMPDEQLEQQRARQVLDAVLDRLPRELRTVFVLAELEALPVKDIAELEQIPLGTASSRLRRAREEFSAIAKRVRAVLSAGRSVTR